MLACTSNSLAFVHDRARIHLYLPQNELERVVKSHSFAISVLLVIGFIQPVFTSAVFVQHENGKMQSNFQQSVVCHYL